MDVKKCSILAAKIRLETLKVIHSRGFGHVGGSMDLADLMAVLYGEVMKFDPKNPRWEDRDWLVLSKGHAGPVAYATFGLVGFYPMEEAYTLNQPHTKFPSHTDRKLTPGVDLTTGSLGQGASTAAGAALGNKIDGRTSHVFCVVGDGEADEGEVWEACSVFIHMLDLVLYRCSCIIQTIQFLFYIVYHGLTDLIFASVVIQYFSNGYSGTSGCTLVYHQLKHPVTGPAAQSRAALNSCDN